MDEGFAQKLVTDGVKRIYSFNLETFAFYSVAFLCPTPLEQHSLMEH